MPGTYFIFAIAFAGWLAAAIGMYRIVIDADVPHRGISFDEAQNARDQYRMFTVFFSAKHKINRILIICGGVVFVGIVWGMIAMAHLWPLCAEGGVQQWCRAN